jgi:PQQ-dependent catabolism-associated CXXCW motif protein
MRTSLRYATITLLFFAFAVAGCSTTPETSSKGGSSIGQVSIPQIPNIQSFSYEDKDWGILARTSPKPPPYGTPTPRSIPGARVIMTLELKALLDSNSSIVVVDVLDSKTRTTVPGAYWIPEGGKDQFSDTEKSRFAEVLQKLTNGDKNRPIVFLCMSSECWESYNASLHAREFGYKDVIWYRGGSNAWTGANLDKKRPERIAW